MKKMMLTLITACMCCAMNAQDDKPQGKRIKLGVKAGVNLANASGKGVLLFTDDESSNSKLGLAIGVFATYEMSDKFSLQPELFYSQQGFKSENSTIKLDYVNIPLLAKYNVSDELGVLVGPQIGFLISSKIDTEQRQTLVPVKSNVVETDLKEFFSNTDFGLNFGVEYQLNNGFGIHTRYNLGLKDIFDYTFFDDDIRVEKNKSKSKMVDSGFIIKNRVFNVSVFYMF